MADERKHDETTAQPQDESSKVHGDKLDPIIPRGADQKGDASAESGQQATPSRGRDAAGGEARAPEENDLTGDRGTGAR